MIAAVNRKHGSRLILRAALMLAAAASLIWGMSSAVIAAEEHAAPAAQIQTLIDEAEPQAAIDVPEGTYRGSLVIHKSITLRSEGTVILINDSGNPAIHITADEAGVIGFTIVDTAPKEAPTVLVEADAFLLEQLHIRTAAHGIKLIDANDGDIRDSTIAWDTADAPAVKLSNRRNGIDLYDSHENRIAGNAITDMHDGIYIESSHHNRVEHNQVDRMRYGIHCMYTNGTVVRGNTGSYNITGAMVMAVKFAEVTDNTFIKQSENVNSQGILLFDAHSSRFYNNVVQGNRVGYYIEMSTDNLFLWNRIEDNFIGIQFIEASGNRLSDNVLTGNVIDAEARASADNELDGNFWDSFRGIDADGDGRSEISNAINPFYLSIVKSRPAFQLFFQSPSMMFLEGMFQGDRASWLADRTPLMKPPIGESAITTGHSGLRTGGIGVILLAMALSTILYLGVRRR